MKEIKGGSVKVLTRTLCHDIMGLGWRVQSQLQDCNIHKMINIRWEPVCPLSSPHLTNHQTTGFSDHAAASSKHHPVTAIELQ